MGKGEGRRKKEEGRRKKEEGRRKIKIGLICHDEIIAMMKDDRSDRA